MSAEAREYRLYLVEQIGYFKAEARRKLHNGTGWRQAETPMAIAEQYRADLRELDAQLDDTGEVS